MSQAVTGLIQEALSGDVEPSVLFKTQAGSTEKTHVELYSKKQLTGELQPKFMGMYLGVYSEKYG